MKQPFLIETDGLSFAYDKRNVLDNLSLQVPAGSIYGFLGPNGAGKTTAIRILLGLISRKKFKVSLFGNDLKNNRLAALQKIGALIESPSLYMHLTGRENLEVCRRILGVPPSRIDEVLKIVGLTKRAGEKAKKYSLGMKQRLGIAMALLNDPELLILDEPANGLDPNGIIEMRKLILKLNREMGITIFISSHILSEVEQIATHVAIIDQGKLNFQGTLAELQAMNSTLLRIETDNTAKAAELLAVQAYEILEQTEEDLLVVLNDKKRIAELNKQLVAHDINVFDLSLKRANLENMFLNLTQKEI